MVKNQLIIKIKKRRNCTAKKWD